MRSLSVTLVLVIVCYAVTSDADRGGGYGLTYEKWQNGHFGYDPNSGTYGMPHDGHNAIRGYGGYGNIIRDDYYGYTYGVLGRGSAKGYNRWNPIKVLKYLNSVHPEGGSIDK